MRRRNAREVERIERIVSNATKDITKMYIASIFVSDNFLNDDVKGEMLETIVENIPSMLTSLFVGLVDEVEEGNITADDVTEYFVYMFSKVVESINEVDIMTDGLREAVIENVQVNYDNVTDAIESVLHNSEYERVFG